MCRKITDNRGIAIAPILFVIALLAILATAISAGSSTFSAGTSREKARVYATAIVDYSNTVAAAVQRLMAMGCSDTQISFENSVVSGYTNSNSPSDKHCHVFDVAGAGIVWTDPPAGSVPSTNNYTGGTYEFLINSVRDWSNSWYIGSSAEELVLIIEVNKDVADEIRSLLNQATVGDSGGDHNGSHLRQRSRISASILRRIFTCLQGAQRGA